MKLAVIGKDVSASLSPQMHTYLFGRMNRHCTYDRVSIAPSEFSSRIGELLRTYDGLNVTIPFKGAVIPYCKEICGDARVFGAVNTVVTRSRKGYNTDGFGFLLMLENAGIDVGGKRVLVLGVGGAGRSCVKKLAEAGASVFAYEQDEERLRIAYRELGGFTPLGEVPVEPFDVILNCTGIGMHDTVGKTPSVVYAGGDFAPVDGRLLGLAGAAVDLIYEPKQSEFLRVAHELGKKTLSGESMLFYQAYCADCIFLERQANAAEAKRLYIDYTEDRT